MQENKGDFCEHKRRPTCNLSIMSVCI